MDNIQNYESQSLSIVEGSSILEKSDFDLIVSLRDELKDTFLHSQVFRTRTEMDVSVLNDIHFPTEDSKYWQSQREQNVQFSELVAASYEYRKNIIEIKILERDLKKEDDELKAELIRIEIEKKNYIKIQQERVAKDRIREIKEWHEIKKLLQPKLKYGVVDVGNHQLVSYCVQFIKQCINMPATTAVADKNNMLGKLVTTVRVCKEKNVWDLVTNQLGSREMEYVAYNGWK